MIDSKLSNDNVLVLSNPLLISPGQSKSEDRNLNKEETTFNNKS